MVASWPPDPLTTYGYQILQDGIEPQITFVSYDEELIFYLNGALAPMPGVTEGVVLPEGVAGLHPPVNQLSLKGARQIGDTYTDTVYDPTVMTMKVMATARDRARLRTVISQWMAAWPPEQAGTLSWFTPDSGEWTCKVRLFRAPPDKLDYSPGVRSQKLTWSVSNNQAMWSGPDSTSQFNFAYEDSIDIFGRVDLASLGGNWNQHYSATGSGTPVTIDTGGSGTIGSNVGPMFSLSTECTYAKGSSANYVVAAVAFVAAVAPTTTVQYGSHAMSFIGTSDSGTGGISFFGLASPPSGTQTVTATSTSLGTVLGMAVTCASFDGWGSTFFTPSATGIDSSPSQEVTAVSGSLVLWGVCNAANSGLNTALTDFSGTTLQNSGVLNVPFDDEMTLLLGYEAAGTSAVSLSANVAEESLAQAWSAGALTLLPIGAVGTCGTDGVEALWTPEGSESAWVINRWLGQNAVQTVTVGGSPTSFTLTYDGETTEPITYPATDAAVQSALQALVPVIESGNVSVTTPVVFDAMGVGDTEDSSTLSWTHSAVGNYVAAFVSVYQGAVTSITYGGTAMTFKTSQSFDNVPGNGYLYVYELYLDSALAGEQEVEVTLSTSTYATGSTISYNNVASSVAETSVYGYGTACSMSAPSGSNVVVQAFGSQLSTLAQTGNGSLRYQNNYTDLLIFDYASLLIEEGTENHEFSASLPVEQNWAGVQLVLTPATAVTTTGPYAVEFTGALAAKLVPAISGTPTGGTNAYVTVAQTVVGMEAVSQTDNQIVSAQFGVFYTWPFNDGAYVDIWGRWDGNATSPTGVRMRVGVVSITLSRFNAGAETVMATVPIIPLQQYTYTLVCGTSANSREFLIQANGQTLYDYTEVDGGSALGADYRNAGFGMTAGTQYDLFTDLWSQAPPPTVANWSFADNATITQSGHVNLTNFGDLQEFPDFLVYGPGTFTFGDGPGVEPTISFGPLADNQIALVRTNPSFRGVYDLSTAASQQVLNGFQSFVESLFSLAFNNNIPPLVSWFESLFGITPQQGDLYSLLNGRWSNGIPARPTSGTPPTYQWAVTIDGGDASSQVVAAITPRRRWPE